MINNNNDNNNNMKVLSLLSDILAVYFIVPEAFSANFYVEAPSKMFDQFLIAPLCLLFI